MGLEWIRCACFSWAAGTVAALTAFSGLCRDAEITFLTWDFTTAFEEIIHPDYILQKGFLRRGIYMQNFGNLYLPI